MFASVSRRTSRMTREGCRRDRHGYETIALMTGLIAHPCRDDAMMRPRKMTMLT